MIESLRTTQIAFFRFATLCGFFRGSADEVQKVSVQGFVQEKIIWNHLWEHRFSVPDPRVFPPPGGRFSPQTTESPFYDWAHRQPSKKSSEAVSPDQDATRLYYQPLFGKMSPHLSPLSLRGGLKTGPCRRRKSSLEATDNNNIFYLNTVGFKANIAYVAV